MGRLRGRVVVEVLNSRAGAQGQSWHPRLLSFQFNWPSSQMFTAANSIHQGWAHRDGQDQPVPLRSSKSRGGVRYESRWIPERQTKCHGNWGGGGGYHALMKEQGRKTSQRREAREKWGF